jgi:hypothetical protein
MIAAKNLTNSHIAPAVKTGVFEPGNRFALLALKRALGSCKARRMLEIVIEPPTNRIVLTFFVRIELSCVTESPNRTEYSERPLGGHRRSD